MRQIEAAWLGAWLAERATDEVSPVLEIGSSSLRFRTIEKPHIETLVHAPLRARDVRIVTADIRDEDGVEIVGDVFDAEVQARLRAVGARTLLLCNLFEHLVDPQRFAKVCQDLVAPGGLIIVTVPHDYPYHLDPIDTLFRPDVAEIHRLFPGTELVEGKILVDGGRWTDLRKRHGSVLKTLAAIAGDWARMITLRGGVDRARSRLSAQRYLFRTYKIAAAILRVPPQPT
ncbi:MAG: hypothetical protein AAGP08_05085 [Pseudomonadota bacterium]